MDSSINTSQIVETVLQAINSAQNKANEFKDEYIVKMHFGKNFGINSVEFVPNMAIYGWLVKLPNEHLNKTAEIPMETLNNLKLEEVLIQAHHDLQIISVALSHSVKIQEELDDPFKNQFETAYNYVTNAVCELLTAIGQKRLSPYPDVTRNIIPVELINMDRTVARRFDLIVLRECIKTLNYFSNIFEFLKNSQTV